MLLGVVSQFPPKVANSGTVCHLVRPPAVSARPSECLRDTTGRRASQWHQHDTRRAGFITIPSIHTAGGQTRLCYRSRDRSERAQSRAGITVIQSQGAADRSGGGADVSLCSLFSECSVCVKRVQASACCEVHIYYPTSTLSARRP